MTDTFGLINHHVLKPATVRAVEAAGRRVVQLVDRWAGGWPKQTRRLDRQGRLLEEAKKQVEREIPAMDYQLNRQKDGVYLTASEVLGLFDIPLGPPVKRPRRKPRT